MFPAGVSPNSVTFRGLVYATSITFAAGFNADLSFQKNGLGEYVELSTGLTIPTGYSGNLDINGLSVPSLTFPTNYPGPFTFNCLTVTSNNGLNYPTNYNGPITIGGSFNVKGNQFPAGYTGPITIGDSGGTFAIANTICRQGASIGFDAGIFIPNTISSLTINNAKTGGTGSLNIKLGAADNFKLLLAGSSDVKGYIEVPFGAALTIDSKEHPGVGSQEGTLKITADSNTAIGVTGSANNGAITINGGKTVATCTGSGAGIGSTSSNTIDTVAHITINNGTVIASANGDGAGIGSGSGATGGYPNDTTSVGAVIQINDGTVTGNGGDVERIFLGSGAYSGAGIGGGKGACADITIAGGNITANSMHGAGIGNGTGGSGVARGSVVITGGTIRGYSMDGANIGAGVGGGYRSTYLINKEADIMMYRRGASMNDGGSLVGWCGNPNGNVDAVGYNGDSHGDGYLVNVFWWDIIKGDLYVYKLNPDGTNAFAKRFPISKDDPYATILFSTGHSETENFRVFVDRSDYYGNPVGMKQAVHYYDHLPPLPGGGPSILQKKLNIIPSITHMNSYPHNFEGATWDTLYAAFAVFVKKKM